MNELMITRRGFVIGAMALAGGMAIGISRPAMAAAALNPEPWAGDIAGPEFSPWLSILANGEIIVRVTPPDIGNGVMTQIAMNLNEELQADWSMVRAEFADTNRNYREDNIYGNVGGPLAYFSGRSTGPERMETALMVGATARERLKKAAAERWGVPVSEVTAENSILSRAGSDETLTYGEVAEAAATVELDGEVTLKPRSEWTTLGKVSRPKLQNPMLVNGQAIFGIDVQLPGKVYAALRQVPVQGGRLINFDREAVMGMPGVLDVVVVDPDEPREPLPSPPPFPIGAAAPQAAVAVIAEHYWQAKTALEALPIEWDLGDGVQWTDNAQIRQTVMDAVQNEGDITVSEGDAGEIVANADRVVEADYFTGYADHVNMEPLNGTALVTDERADVWMPTQHTQQSHMVAAEEAGLPPENVYVHQTFVGGGFGRRVFGDDTRMVVAVAKKYPGKPVHVMWSREESMRQGRFRAMIGAKLKASLGEDGYPTAMVVRHAGRGQGINVFSDTAYVAGKGIPAVQIEEHILPLNFMTGPYRGPSYNVNSFIMESFVDELAHEAGIDPLEYRIKLMEPWEDKGWVKALETVAERAGWGQSLPRGQGMGLAVSNWGGGGRPFYGTTAAAVVRVEVSPEGQLEILQIDATCDVGTIVNPDAVLAQIQGGTIFGLNMSLMEELEIEDGAVVSDNFHRYPMLRMADVPTNIRVHLDGTSGHERINEIGEPPVGPVGPAIGNAIYAAIGKRIRSLPFRTADLTWS
jgi:isoquinoline 1-oxidoreductase beta subunit